MCSKVYMSDERNSRGLTGELYNMLKSKKLNIANNIGAILEYYDYIIFAFLLPFLSDAFFPTDSPNLKFIKSLFIFSIGAWSRILGSFIFGYISDLRGRKFTIISSIYLMSFSSLLIGLLPTYSSIGIFAPILLGMLRFLQGIAYSAELPTMVIYVEENNKTKNSYITSLVIASTSIGSIAASFTVYYLTTHFSKYEISGYLWRIPFIIGALIGGVGFYLRRNLEEDFSYVKKEFNINSISSNFLSLGKAFFIIYLPAIMIINNLFFSKSLLELYSYKLEDIQFAVTIGLVSAALTAPVAGYIIDSLKSYNIIFLAFLLLYPLINYFLKFSFFLPFYTIFYQILLTFMMVLALTYVSKMFDKNIRGRMVSFIYNFTFLIASLTPMLFKGNFLIFVIPYLACMIMCFIIKKRHI